MPTPRFSSASVVLGWLVCSPIGGVAALTDTPPVAATPPVVTPPPAATPVVGLTADQMYHILVAEVAGRRGAMREALPIISKPLI